MASEPARGSIQAHTAGELGGRNGSTACEEIAKGPGWENRDLRRSGDGKRWLKR